MKGRAERFDERGAAQPLEGRALTTLAGQPGRCDTSAPSRSLPAMWVVGMHFGITILGEASPKVAGPGLASSPHSSAQDSAGSCGRGCLLDGAGGDACASPSAPFPSPPAASTELSKAMAI
jgi:hypothetical protein